MYLKDTGMLTDREDVLEQAIQAMERKIVLAKQRKAAA